MTMGSLFYVAPDNSVASADAQNIYGKYRILRKTANFFSNQFTWMIVIFSILVFAVIVRIVRNWLKNKQEIEIIKTKLDQSSGANELNQSQISGNGEEWY